MEAPWTVSPALCPRALIVGDEILTALGLKFPGDIQPTTRTSATSLPVEMPESA
jgi:hypothetical protein